MEREYEYGYRMFIQFIMGRGSCSLKLHHHKLDTGQSVTMAFPGAVRRDRVVFATESIHSVLLTQAILGGTAYC
jgi:hypothetical protein